MVLGLIALFVLMILILAMLANGLKESVLNSRIAKRSMILTNCK